MKDLIKITKRDGGDVVSARELHKFLEASERFQSWFERQIQYGFEESVDYIGCKTFNTQANQQLQDYALTLDTSKEISMLQKSEKGKVARRYFISCEKALKTKSLDFTDPDTVLQLAQNWKQEREKRLLAEQVNEENKPKVLFADSVSGSDGSILIRDFAKLISDDHFSIGQNRLYHWLRENNYLMKDNSPYQTYVDRGYFEVIERTVGSGAGTKIRKTTKMTGKGQVYFAKKIRSLDAA